ncbi:hypothetical protein [Microbulbifer aggregans]|uniref:hypothetical protein n=1 Tax=Microbulbifer aggregans TaxID=1769779 RepID=UPI001CFE37CD|nr:hypothetical protein [Microbulbifer aggregans]
MSIPIVLSRRVYCVIVSLLLAGALGVSLWITRQQVSPPTLSDYHTYQCNAAAASRDDNDPRSTFRILTVTSMYAREVADYLCASPVVAKYYAGIEISWKPRRYLTAEQLLNEEYDLIWSRAHNMRGLVPEFSNYYDTLLRIGHYQVYWFSREQKPEITAPYLKGRRLGLLNDRLSHTHYLLPLESLKQAGVAIDQQELVYFDDALSLVTAFRDGSIDLISGGLWLEQDLDIPLQRTLISDSAVAAGLFVRRQRAAAVDCEIIAAFQQVRAFFGDGSEMEVEGHDCAAI